MQTDYLGEVRSFVVANYLLGRGEGFSDDDSFLEQGIIDSTGILELVSHLEESYGIEVADDELIPDNLDSIHRIAGYLSRKTAAIGTAETPLQREVAFFS
jgi:acyl carrier protein